MSTTLESTRVVKKMSPAQPGAVKLARRFGDALVCVRYRHDAQGQQRYTMLNSSLNACRSKPAAGPTRWSP